jgi:hypothetical protein
MFLRISAYLCVHLTQNPLTGSNEATQSFIGAVLNGGVPLSPFRALIRLLDRSSSAQMEAPLARLALDDVLS